MKKGFFFAMVIFMLFATAVLAGNRWRAAWDVPVRPDPRPSETKLTTIKAGQVVEELGRHKWWIKVKVNGKTGWVSKHSFEKVEGISKYDLVVANVISKAVADGFDNWIYVRNDGDASFAGTFGIEAYHGKERVLKERYKATISAGGGTKVRFKTNKQVHRAVLYGPTET